MASEHVNKRDVLGEAEKQLYSSATSASSSTSIAFAGILLYGWDYTHVLLRSSLLELSRAWRWIRGRIVEKRKGKKCRGSMFMVSAMR